MLVEKLLSCYIKPPDAMIAEMDKVTRQISDEDQARIFDTILDTMPTGAKIGVKDIRDACRRLGISFTQALHIKARSVSCDACGTRYQYHPAPTDDQELDQGIHDRCPVCGFQMSITIAYQGYVELGMEPEWYKREILRYQNHEYGIGKKKWFNLSQRLADRKKAAIEATEARIRMAELAAKLGGRDEA